MKTISQIYDDYKIMPTLREHMLRVAAVASMICDSIDTFTEKEDAIAICLVHDMGNIIKFDLNYFPKFLEPEGLEYWQQVKDNYIAKYGSDEHAATEVICKEIGLSEERLLKLDFIGFSMTEKTLATDSLLAKICCYADMRVGPLGVLSINERLADGRKRYAGRADKVLATERFERLASALKDLEKQIFDKSEITPEMITDAAIASRIEELRSATIGA